MQKISGNECAGDFQASGSISDTQLHAYSSLAYETNSSIIQINPPLHIRYFKVGSCNLQPKIVVNNTIWVLMQISGMNFYTGLFFFF